MPYYIYMVVQKRLSIHGRLEKKTPYYTLFFRGEKRLTVHGRLGKKTPCVVTMYYIVFQIRASNSG